MLPAIIDAQQTELLKLLNKMDECRSELDEALANHKTERAADHLRSLKALANAIDQQVQQHERQRRVAQHADQD